MTPLAVALAVLAGLAGSVQVAVMGRFGGSIGVFEALTFSTAVQLVFSVAILLARDDAASAGCTTSATRPRGCGSAA